MAVTDIREQLAGALRDLTLMRFHRRFEDGWVRGYVVGIGPAFVMLLELSDHMRFNGFGCYRITDLKNLQPAPFADFVDAALKGLGEVAPETPAVVLDSVDDILETAGRLFPIVTVYTTESRAPEVNTIGAIISLEGGVVWMREIGPDAAWDAKTTARRLEAVTRIDFGGAYETALALVGGPAPAPQSSPPPLRLVTEIG